MEKPIIFTFCLNFLQQQHHQLLCAVLKHSFQKKSGQTSGMRLRISSGRIVSGQTAISLPLQEVQTSKHYKNIFKTKGLKSQNENIPKDKQRKCENAITLDIDFLCRIHPHPTVSDEVFCGEMDKSIKGQHWIAIV